MKPNMKKLIIALAAVLLLSGCGVGSYSVSSGKADNGEVSFTDTKVAPINVVVDKQTYNIKTVKLKAWTKDRNIRKTVQNTISLPSGKHDVTVYNEQGLKVYNKTLYISAGEHKVIDL